MGTWRQKELSHDNVVVDNGCAAGQSDRCQVALEQLMPTSVCLSFFRKKKPWQKCTHSFRVGLEFGSALDPVHFSVCGSVEHI